jgi:aminoglycoside/choline kinase family phosphotransferase
VWCDFEDTCRGPLAWDLASLRRTPRLDGAAAVRAPMRERREQRPTTTRSRRGSPFATCT